MSAGRRRFRIIKEIAEGGFGKVYLAEQISSDGFSRIVAVKLLHAKWSSHDEVVMRTRDEARLLGLIRHQHIVKVEDLTSIDSKCAIVMEYLEGCDLKWMISFLQERSLDFPRAALFEIVLAVASALDAAYNGIPLQGGQPLRVIHRDIKPSNIFVTVAGGVKVLDFGTARANFAEREAKTQALAFGSQGYMAPERMLGEEDTPAADIFSLGIALYEILSLESFGRIPPRPNKFAAKVEERVRSLPLSGDPEWCDQVRDTLRLMLSYEASERPTAAQLVEIMELLAQDANDMGLRRFCRTLVAEAKANLPDVDTADPLTGRIVEEDQSAGFGSKAGAGVQETFMDEEDDDMVAPPTERIRPEDLARLTSGNRRGDVSAPTQRVPTKSEPSGAAHKVPIAPEESGGSGLVLAFGGMTITLLAIVALAVVLVLLIAGLVLYGMQPPTPRPVPEPTEKPDPQPTTPDPQPTTPDPVQPTGPEPTTPDPAPTSGAAVTVKTANAGGVAVELTILGPVEDVLIRGSGYEATWTGPGAATLDLEPGKYKANIRTPEKLHRYKEFEVVAKRKSCAFTFDPAVESWSGDCKR